jgi:hypothetical protein
MHRLAIAAIVVAGVAAPALPPSTALGLVSALLAVLATVER